MTNDGTSDAKKLGKISHRLVEAQPDKRWIIIIALQKSMTPMLFVGYSTRPIKLATAIIRILKINGQYHSIIISDVAVSFLEEVGSLEKLLSLLFTHCVKNF